MHSRLSRPIRLLLVAALGAVAFAAPAPSAEAVEKKVLIIEGKADDASTWRFEPADITVKAGDTVVWQWQATDEHSATADDGSFDSGVKKGNGTVWKHKFAKAGSFPYSCIPHPYMYGQVNVT
jgi:plastocyanin